MSNFLVAILNDLGTGRGAPGSSVLSASVGQTLRLYWAKKAAEARDVLMHEMSRGTRHALEVADNDETIAICHRYSRAAFEGAARLNLRLMAKVISGQALSGSLYAREFHEFANDLESLTVAEIVFLGTLVKLTEQNPELPKSDGSTETYGVAQSVGILLRKTLLETEHFPSDESFRACGLALQRTGLVFDSVHLSGGDTILGPSPRLVRLTKLVDFRDALLSEGIIFPTTDLE